jgi:hypothetical protein
MTTVWHFLTPALRGTLLAVAAALALAAGAHPALAQYGGLGPSTSNPSSLTGEPRIQGPSGVKQPEAPPDALPGAAARGDRVAPAQGPAIADPTEALFDAINRGDIASARDAIDRGADLEAHSVLGMTPLDQSVDLGRNDITFLLLSLRNGDTKLGHRVSTATAQTAGAAKPAPAQAAAQAKAAARAPATSPAKQTAQVASAPPVAPRLFAGDGGTPNPAVGFLGFDSRH